MKSSTLMLSIVSTWVPAAAAHAEVYQCSSPLGSNCDGLINDGRGSLESTLLVLPSSCPSQDITDLNVHLRLTHQSVGDLVVSLHHPTASEPVYLMFQHGRSYDTPACAAADVDAVFSDEGEAPACSGLIPGVTGQVRPLTPLDLFDGLPRVGVWTLHIEDESVHGYGALDGWSLDLPCALPEVSLAVSDAIARESDGDPAVITVTRTGSPSGALLVRYLVGGTATGGDYAALPGEVSIADGSTSATITVTPTADGLSEPAETVILTLSPQGEYTVGSPNHASVEIVAAASDTALAASASSAVHGSPITLTATVTSSGGVPAGSVRFGTALEILADVQLDAGGVATLTVSDLPLGEHVISAQYQGSNDHAASLSPGVTVVVSSSPTVVALSSSINPADEDDIVTFTALLTSTLGSPEGTMTFKRGETVLAIIGVVSGVATFSSNSLGVGTHAITAEFSSSSDWYPDATSAPLSQVVAAPPPEAVVDEGCAATGTSAGGGRLLLGAFLGLALFHARRRRAVGW